MYYYLAIIFSVTDRYQFSRADVHIIYFSNPSTWSQYISSVHIIMVKIIFGSFLSVGNVPSLDMCIANRNIFNVKRRRELWVVNNELAIMISTN